MDLRTFVQYLSLSPPHLDMIEKGEVLPEQYDIKELKKYMGIRKIIFWD